MNKIIKNVEIHWARLGEKPLANNFGEVVWEMQMRVRDKQQAIALRDDNFNVKQGEDDNGTYYSVNLKRRGTKKDGSPNEPVKVVDGQVQPMDGSVIGNGSVGNVKVWQYQNSFGSTSSVLMAVQVTKLLEYVPEATVDFEVFEGLDPAPKTETTNETPSADKDVSADLW